MTNPTELKPTTLLAVEVPEDARNFKITHNSKSLLYEVDAGVDYIEFKIIQLGEILGTCTAEEISFDVAEHLDDSENNKIIYPDYDDEYGRAYYESEKDSFRSLLTANDIHFVNPYGERPETDLEAFLNWETAENNLVKKLIIIKRIT